MIYRNRQTADAVLIKGSGYFFHKVKRMGADDIPLHNGLHFVCQKCAAFLLFEAAGAGLFNVSVCDNTGDVQLVVDDREMADMIYLHFTDGCFNGVVF